MPDEVYSWTVTTHDWTRSVDASHLAQIRERAAVYAQGGLRHLVLEVLAYADDEAAAAGRPGTVVVATGSDGSVSVRDDGRGTDTRRTSGGEIVRKPVMATKDVRFFDHASRQVLADGLPRWGMSVVAALSTTLVHENRRVDGCWRQTYHHGIPAAELVETPGDGTTGATVTFTPDSQVDGDLFLVPSDLTAFNSLRISLEDCQAPSNE
ncbi:ATP-binding protein [Calidifontibacter sp. DB0510]|uniref:DNA topoisomerase (ATP-hydrolyzing) n=2 Tax=Metallococcus carri TaxID=1656884 RepID=A0A967EA50_9MICO|nr:ATP-binding protein [Metallococcus carri]NOP39039.1 ATP-binding protein [Calidifontibacter sp. DB2511S]